MRVILIPLFRLIRVIFKIILYTWFMFSGILAFILFSLWTFKPIDCFYKIYSDLYEELNFFREYSAYSMEDDFYYSWSNPIAFIFDINNKLRFETDNKHNRMVKEHAAFLDSMLERM